jgi:hypothetical protein
MKTSRTVFKVFLLLSILITAFSCKKDDDKDINTFTGGPGVYVIGYIDFPDTTFGARVWKDGKEIKLVTGSFANAITTSGNDVYIGGIDNDFKPVYWKNGIKTVMDAPPTRAVYVNGIAVQGPDVFVSGSYFDSKTYVPIYWKNGKINLLPYKPSFYAAKETNAIIVQGSDVYILGESDNKGVYWKNGVLVNIPNAIEVYDMAISGNDIYITGQTTDYHGAYWKNGVQTILSDGNFGIVCSAIGIQGNDIVIAGYRTQVNYSGDAYKGFSWKNGVFSYFNINNQFPETMRLTLDKGNIYISGTSSPVYRAAVTYWLNGSPTYLTTEFSHAQGIVVIPQ